ARIRQVECCMTPMQASVGEAGQTTGWMGVTASSRRHSRWRIAVFAVVSLGISIPCVWRPHIQADDLSSHLYNAWLVNQVSAGQLPGLYLVPQFTNVLFDHLLSLLMKSGSVVLTERIAVLAAVQVFFWGCFFLASVVAGRAAWTIAPFLALLT